MRKLPLRIAVHRSGFRNLRGRRSPMRPGTGLPNRRQQAPHLARRPLPLGRAIPIRPLDRMPPSELFPTRRIVRRLPRSGRRAHRRVRKVLTRRPAQLTRRARGIPENCSALLIPLNEPTPRPHMIRVGKRLLVPRSLAARTRILGAAITHPEMFRDKMYRTGKTTSRTAHPIERIRSALEAIARSNRNRFRLALRPPCTPPAPSAPWIRGTRTRSTTRRATVFPTSPQMPIPAV